MYTRQVVVRCLVIIFSLSLRRMYRRHRSKFFSCVVLQINLRKTSPNKKESMQQHSLNP